MRLAQSVDSSVKLFHDIDAYFIINISSCHFWFCSTWRTSAGNSCSRHWIHPWRETLAKERKIPPELICIWSQRCWRGLKRAKKKNQKRSSRGIPGIWTDELIMLIISASLYMRVKLKIFISPYANVLETLHYVLHQSMKRKKIQKGQSFCEEKQK